MPKQGGSATRRFRGWPCTQIVGIPLLVGLAMWGVEYLGQYVSIHPLIRDLGVGQVRARSNIPGLASAHVPVRRCCKVELDEVPAGHRAHALDVLVGSSERVGPALPLARHQRDAVDLVIREPDLAAAAAAAAVDRGPHLAAELWEIQGLRSDFRVR